MNPKSHYHHHDEPESHREPPSLYAAIVCFGIALALFLVWFWKDW